MSPSSQSLYKVESAFVAVTADEALDMLTPGGEPAPDWLTKAFDDGMIGLSSRGVVFAVSFMAPGCFSDVNAPVFMPCGTEGLIVRGGGRGVYYLSAYAVYALGVEKVDHA